MSQKKYGVILSYGGILVSVLTNLLYVPVMLRLLGQSEYGVYSLSSSVIGYLSLLYAGMTSTYLRYYSKYRKEQDEGALARLNALFLVLFSVLGLCALLGGLFLSSHLQWVLGGGLTEAEFALAQILFVIMSFNMALLMPKTVLASMVMAQERFIFIKGLDIVRSIAVPCITLPLLYLGFGSVGIAMVVLFATLVDLLCNLYYCLVRLRNRFSFRRIPFSLLPDMATFSFFLFLQGIMDQLNWQLGKLILANFADSAAIAVYSVGLQIDLLFITFSTAFSGVVMPQIYALVQAADRAGLSALWLRTGRMQFYVVFFIWLGFLLYGEAFIRLWAGAGYEDAYIVALLLMTPIVIHLSQQTGQEMLRACNRHGGYVIAHLAFAIVGFLICIPLTKSYGVLGVAAGTAITSFLVTMGFDNWYFAKAGNLDVPAFFRGLVRLLPSAALCTLMGIALRLCVPIHSWGGFLLAACLFVLFYGILMYFFGMNSYEKGMLRGFLKRRKK